MTSDTCLLPLPWQHPCELLCTLWNIALQPACFVFTLGWKRLCQTLKTILSTKWAFYVLSTVQSISVGFAFLSGVLLPAHKASFLQSNIPRDCIGRTTAARMLCLVVFPQWLLVVKIPVSAWAIQLIFFFVAQHHTQQQEWENRVAFVRTLHFAELGWLIRFAHKGDVCFLRWGRSVMLRPFKGRDAAVAEEKPTTVFPCEL